MSCRTIPGCRVGMRWRFGAKRSAKPAIHSTNTRILRVSGFTEIFTLGRLCALVGRRPKRRVRWRASGICALAVGFGGLAESIFFVKECALIVAGYLHGRDCRRKERSRNNGRRAANG